MATVRQRVLNEYPKKVRPVAADAVQGGIFAFIFAELEYVLEGPLKLFLFPAAFAISCYKNWVHWKNYKREKNKSLGKTTALIINSISTFAEFIAVSLTLIVAATGFLFLSAFIPAIFLGMIAFNFVSHALQLAYHVGVWAFSKKYTMHSKKHAEQIAHHLRLTLLLGVVGAGIGLLMLTPAFHLAAWSAAFISTCKIIVATIIGLNVAVTAKEAYNIIYKEQKLSEAKSKLAIKSSQPQQEVKPQSTFSMQKFLFPNNAEPLKANYENDLHKNLKNDDVDDLILTLEASPNNTSKKTLLDLLQQAETALLVDLNPKASIKLNPVNERPVIDSASFFDFQQEKRIDKLHAVLLLTKLINDDFQKPFTVRIIINNDIRDHSITSVQDLLNYFEAYGKDVFKSSFANHGKIQKLFVLAEHYEQYRALHPKNHDDEGFITDTDVAPREAAP